MLLKVTLAFIALVASPTVASTQCNMYKFGVGAVIPCGLQWWQSNDLGQSIKVSKKMSDFARSVMDAIDPALYSGINSTLAGQIAAESDDPLAKIIESAHTMLPSLANYLADVAYSLDLTPQMLYIFNLPEEFATKEFLQQMEKEYFDFSCSDYGAKEFTSCVSNWVNSNCGAADNVAYLNQILNSLANEYCNGNSTKPSVLTTFNKDFGEFGKGLVKAYGIEKDPSSPFQFRLSNSSLISGIISGANLRAFTNIANTCTHLTLALVNDITELSQQNSTIGTGAALQSLEGGIELYVECSLQTVGKLFPELITPSTLDKYELVLQRFGFRDLNLASLAAVEETTSMNALVTSPTVASTQCNMYNFGVGAGLPCGLQWWQSNDFGQSIQVSKKMSDFARSVMDAIDPALYSGINSTLARQITAESDDPLAKIIESALTVLPSLANYLADVAYSLDLTPEMLYIFNLPEEFATKEFLQQMADEYFDFSCSEYGAKKFTSCVSNWVNSNCGAEDNVAYLNQILNSLANEYCNANSTKPSVLTTFNKDFGEFGKGLVKLYGIEKDPSSQFQFRLSNSSLISGILSGANLTAFTDIANTCTPLTLALVDDITELSQQNSTIGTGAALESLERGIEFYVECTLQTVGKLFPELITPSTIDKYELILRRFGFQDLDLSSLAAVEETTPMNGAMSKTPMTASYLFVIMAYFVWRFY